MINRLKDDYSMRLLCETLDMHLADHLSRFAMG